MTPRNPKTSHYGNRGATVPADMQARILQMCRDGVTRNDIHRQTGVAAASVSAIVERAGLTFDRSGVAAATAARTADLRSQRAIVSAKLIAKANALLDEMDAPFLAFSIGGKDNVYTEHMLDNAPTGDKRNLIQAAAVAIGRHLDLEQHDVSTGGAADIRSMLTAFGRALGLPDA